MGCLIKPKILQAGGGGFSTITGAGEDLGGSSEHSNLIFDSELDLAPHMQQLKVGCSVNARTVQKILAQ